MYFYITSLQFFVWVIFCCCIFQQTFRNNAVNARYLLYLYTFVLSPSLMCSNAFIYDVYRFPPTSFPVSALVSEASTSVSACTSYNTTLFNWLGSTDSVRLYWLCSALLTLLGSTDFARLYWLLGSTDSARLYWLCSALLTLLGSTDCSALLTLLGSTDCSALLTLLGSTDSVRLYWLCSALLTARLYWLCSALLTLLGSTDSARLYWLCSALLCSTGMIRLLKAFSVLIFLLTSV